LVLSKKKTEKEESPGSTLREVREGVEAAGKYRCRGFPPTGEVKRKKERVKAGEDGAMSEVMGDIQRKQFVEKEKEKREIKAFIDPRGAAAEQSGTAGMRQMHGGLILQAGEGEKRPLKNKKIWTKTAIPDNAAKAKTRGLMERVSHRLAKSKRQKEMRE